MSRITDAFLPLGVAYRKGSETPVIDLRVGGVNGYAPDLTNWISNQAYVRRNVIPLLVEAPAIFNYLPNPEVWIGTLRALIEVNSLSITGLNYQYNVEVVDGNPVGGGGQIQQEFVNVTMERSNPTHRWNERYGLAIYRHLTGWVRYAMMDPEAKVAMVNTIPGNNVSDLLPDQYGAVTCYLEPDPLHTKVNKSWLCANMFPINTIGQNHGGQRELTAGGEITVIDQEFSALTQTGAGVTWFAQQLLDAINITNANPYNRQAFKQDIDNDVKSTNLGYQQGIEDLAQTSLKP